MATDPTAVETAWTPEMLAPHAATTESAGEPPEDDDDDAATAAPQILFSVTRVQDLAGTNGQTVAERVELTPASTSAAHDAHLDPGHQQASAITFTVSNPAYLHFFEPGKFVVAHFERLEPDEAVALAQPSTVAAVTETSAVAATA